MALLVTLLIVSLIYVVTVQFNTTMWSNLHAAANLKDGIQLAGIARSGFNAARAVIAVDGMASPAVDSFRDSWADMSIISGYSSSFFEDGRFVVKVNDYSGRIQLNALVKNDKVNEEQKKFLERFLSSSEFGLEKEEVTGIIEAITDWIDKNDDVTGFGGAENLFYQSQEKPYVAKNGPIESLEELLYIKGISRELYYGSAGRPGIADYLTPYGDDGKVNINTSSPLVLRAMAEQIDEAAAVDMAAYRDDEDNDLSSTDWYKNVPSFPGDVVINPALLTTTSTYFEIISEGWKENMKRGVRGMIKRTTGETEILAWKME